MVVEIKFSDVDFTRFISDIHPIVKESKKSVTNIKGNLTLLKSRSSIVSTSLEISLPYLPIQKLQELVALFGDGAAVDIQHNLDFQTGLMVCVDFKTALLKSLDGALYNVVLTVDQTTPPVSGTMQPVNPHTLSAAQITKLLGV